VAARELRAAAFAAAPPEVLWELLANVGRWTEWTMLSRASLERPGSPDPQGVGAIRRLGRGPAGSREEVVEFDPPRRFSYVMHSGMMPVREYRAVVTLEPRDGGTAIAWHSRWEDRAPVPGLLMQAILSRLIQRFASGLARRAEAIAGGDTR